MTMQILQAPAAEPVSVAELRAWLRLVQATEDAQLLSCIRAARQLVEDETGRALVTRRVRETRDGWVRDGRIRLGLAPVTAIVTVRAATNGVWRDIPLPSSFDADGGAIAFAAPLSASVTLSIDYEAGYGGPEAAPPALRHAVLVVASALFNGRGNEGLGDWARTLAGAFRRPRL